MTSTPKGASAKRWPPEGSEPPTPSATTPGPAAPPHGREPAGEFSRNIQGINGRLAAIQNNNEKPVLQLTNLQGDIIATAEDNETATTPLSTSQEPSEYGHPRDRSPTQVLLARRDEIPTELPSGITTMGIRPYIPQLGRFSNPTPSPPARPTPTHTPSATPSTKPTPRANTRNTRSAGPRPQASPTQIKAQPKPPPNRPPKTPPPAQQHNARSKNKSEPNWKQPGPDPTPSSQKPQTKKNGNGKKKAGMETGQLQPGRRRGEEAPSNPLCLSALRRRGDGKLPTTAPERGGSTAT